MLPGIILLQATTSPLETALDTLLTTLVAQHAVFLDLGRAIGGFGAILYIFYRIWAHMARNEEIDVYGLLRPVTLAFCIMFYSQIAAGVIYLTKVLDTGTRPLVTSQVATINSLNAQKDAALTAKRGDIFRVNPDLDGNGDVTMLEKLTSYLPMVSISQIADNALSYLVSKWIDEILMKLGEWAYNGAAIAMKFFVTFFMLILLILGPVTLGLANFEWFYGGLASWVSRLIHFMLWLPIINVLGGMLEQVHIIMLQVDIQQIKNTPDDQFTESDFGMIVFYIMGTAAYLMVPKVASWVVESTGADQSVKSLAGGVGKMGALGGAVGGGLGGLIRKAPSMISKI